MSFLYVFYKLNLIVFLIKYYSTSFLTIFGFKSTIKIHRLNIARNILKAFVESHMIRISHMTIICSFAASAFWPSHMIVISHMMIIFHKFNKYRNNLIWGGYVRFCRMLWSYEIVAYDLVNMRKIKNKYKIHHIVSSHHWCGTNKYRSLGPILVRIKSKIWCYDYHS